MIARRSFLALAAFFAVAACGGGDKATDPNTLRVGVTPIPHAEILEFVKPALAKQGLNLDIVVFNDYVQPNLQLEQGAIDANYFQIQPYLTDYKAERGSKIVPIAGVHLEPLGLYSSKWKRFDQVPAGASVAIPNDASSEGRALRLLKRAGLISLRDTDKSWHSISDIVANPRKLQLRALEAATLPRVFPEVDLAVINTNYALDAKLDPRKDSLIIEEGADAFPNLIVVRPGSEKDPRLLKLVAALHTQAVRDFIDKKYRGAVIPAF